MKRRDTLIAVATVCLGRPLGAAQPMPPGGRPWRIGWLTPGAPAGGPSPVLQAFVEGMRDRGWSRDTHYVLELRTGSNARQYVVWARDLVAWKPDLLIGIETTARLMRQYTETIPIVLIISIDPEAAGLVRSLARPGTNVTGMSGHFDAVVVKWIEAVVEIVPQARHIVYLADPGWSDSLRAGAVMETAARAKGAELSVAPVSADVASVQQAFDGFARRRPDGLVIPIQGGALTHAALIKTLVRQMRLPAVGLLDAGAVVQISPDFAASARESTDFVDQILRGARPADLPVRRAQAFVVTLNTGLARELGIALPASLRARAHRVIE